MAGVLYTAVIWPLIQIMELVYAAFDRTFYIHGVSIIGISVCVTALSLPLHAAAERWRRREREAERRLEAGVRRIRAAFRGDERHMILAVYYRQNHYHPVMALRATFGLLVQIPFFIAANSFLAGLQQLDGAGFLVIRDMGKPDALLRAGGRALNILPVAMTALNIAAGALYTKGLRLREKLPVYGSALLFLVILYKSPSGLALYWTTDSLLFLVKNIYCRLKNPRRALLITAAASVSALTVSFRAAGKSPADSGRMTAVCLLALLLPAVLSRAGVRFRPPAVPDLAGSPKKRFLLFALSSAALWLITGLAVPSAVIASSPQEFPLIGGRASPLFFIRNSLLQAAGIFIVWPAAVYLLSSGKTQTVLSALSCVLTLGAAANVFFFPGSHGILSPSLTFEDEGGFPAGAGRNLLNIACLTAAAAAVPVLLKKRGARGAILSAAFLAAGAGGTGVRNCLAVRREFRALPAAPAHERAETLRPVFRLSRRGKNVFILMLDRAISGFLPVIMEEAPELKSQYSGFVYYPNTVSFGFFTIQGAPALFGGYEYTPLAINTRSAEPLVQKHNEALAVLPRLFAQNGFSVSVADAPWASYSWISDMSYMRGYPEKISTLHTMRRYKSEWYAAHGQEMPDAQSGLTGRNLIRYAVMRALPLCLRKAAYNGGSYWAAGGGCSRNDTFLDSYSVLDFLPRLTDGSCGTDTFTILDNDTTHDPVLCQAPDYVPAENVTDRGNTPFASNEHYHANAAAIHRIAAWLSSLKARGLYDNTRIIIVSDHGRGIRTGRFEKERRLPFRREFCNPLLLVKDFGADGDLKTDLSFMTNADVPSLAAGGVIENPVNPFTKKPLAEAGNKNRVTITASRSWLPAQQSKNTFASAPCEWYTVHTDIFDEDNWAAARPAPDRIPGGGRKTRGRAGQERHDENRNRL